MTSSRNDKFKVEELNEGCYISFLNRLLEVRKSLNCINLQMSNPE